MTSSRDKKSELLSESSLNDGFCLLDWKYPHSAKPKSKLLFPLKTYEDLQERSSAHPVNKTVKARDDIDLEQIKKLRKLENVQRFYFFKNNKPGSPISELEALCGAFYRFIAPENVPATHAYYDEDNEVKFIGVTSKAIPGFKTNHDVPLEETDTFIELIKDLIEEETEIQSKKVSKDIEELTNYLDKIFSSTQNSYMESSVQYIKNLYNFYWSSAYTAVKLRETLVTFKNSDPKLKFSPQSIQALLDFLRNRVIHIEKDLNDPDTYRDELVLLKNLTNSAENLLDLALQKAVTISANRKLEEAYKLTKANGIDLEKLKDEEKITCDGFSITVKDLKNYRIVKRLAVALVTRYLMQDTDGHNQNMSKDGWLIDFDMAKLRILFQFRNPDFWDRRLRQPSERTFIVTARDIAEFPNIRDADFYYWPTKATLLTKSMAKKISWVYTVRENFFEKKDNDVFQKLSTNPVFIFHKYKTLLKYILTDGNMFRNIGKLHLREDLTYRDENDGKFKNLLDEIINDEEARIQKVRDVLIKMPEFQKFLAHNGKYVLQLIKDEFLDYRNKYKLKLKEKPYYKELVNSINLEEIHKRYKQIFIDAGADKIKKQNHQPTTTLEPFNPEFSMLFNTKV